MRSWLVIGAWTIACAPLTIGCATGTASDDSSSTDSGSSKDSTAPKGDGGGCPTGYTGAGCSNCVGGFHKCGTECHQDNANAPDAGCTTGCGAPCSTPKNATATCTTDGHCDFACDTSFDKIDGGCDCPSGTILCNGSTCQQCCVDTDCVGHQMCNGGTCQGCQAGWGDCNNSTNDGCETHLNSTSNCGSCGHSCCGSFCGCGFLGVGGEKCNTSGNSFSCGC